MNAPSLPAQALAAIEVAVINDKADPRQISPVTFDDIWQLANREWARADARGDKRSGEIFYAIGRLVEILKDDPEVKDRMRTIVARERAVAENIAAAHERKLETEQEQRQ